MTDSIPMSEAPQGIVGRVVNFVTGGKSAKDKLGPKKVGFSEKSKAVAAASNGTGGGDATKPAKPKRPTLGAREVSRRLGLSLPLHVAARACQNDMERLAPQVGGSGRKMAIHGRAAAVTTVAAIEYMASQIYKSAISHARKRGASTVSLLDVQRGIIVDPRLSRSLRYSRVAVSKSANPLGIVPGMMIGIKYKKKAKTQPAEHEVDAEEHPAATVAVNKKTKKTAAAQKADKHRATPAPPPQDETSADSETTDDEEQEEREGDEVDF